MTYTMLAKIAPVVTPERVDDPRALASGRQLYDSGGLTFLHDEVPLLVDHRDERVVGRVHELFTLDDVDGPWIAASSTVTDPPCWLSRDTRVSFGFRVIQRNEHEGWCPIVRRAFVDEVSILAPSTQPVEPCARVWSYRRAEPATKSPAAVPTSDRAAAGEIDDYRPAYWDELERIVGYRITDANFEHALVQAQRSELDQIYDEAVAARRTEPQVLYRPGIGQVLGVR
jgi:hypothetical protein